MTGRSPEAQHIHLPVTGRSAKAHYEAPRDIHHYSPFCSPSHGKLEKQLFRVLLHGEILIVFCDRICDSVCDSTVGSVPLRIVATSLQIHLSSLCTDAHRRTLVHKHIYI